MHSLYIHIPFCTSKCQYCRFASFSGISQIKIEYYVHMLCKEILTTEKKGEKLDTIYFGGGTPSTLHPNQLKRIFQTLQEVFIFSENIEISLESTPERITKENLIGWMKLGINRISMGIQSLNPKTLDKISRSHKGDIFTALDTLDTFTKKLAKDISINLDFIIGLPYVKNGELASDIKYLLKKYNYITHISVYMLEDYYEVGEIEESKFEAIVYPNDWKSQGIDEYSYLTEYLGISALLKNYGFHKYELSNFSKAGYECQHNIGYWKHKPMLAFGLGAHGFLDNTRFSNSEDFTAYYKTTGKISEKLSKEDIFCEKIMFSLRTNGIPKELWKGLDMKKVDFCIEKNLLKKENNLLKLDKKGILLLDSIITEIII